MDTIIAKLNELSDVQAALAIARFDYETKRAEILKQGQPTVSLRSTDPRERGSSPED
jgi:hypothetical protein